MAVAGVVPSPRLRTGISPVTVLRIAAVIGLWILWEAVAASGLLYRGVIPSSFAILRAFFAMVITLDLWRNLAVTAYEVLGALLIGGVIGLACGLALGASKFLSRAYEPFAHYLAPTPKIVFLPVLMVAFGVGPGSKLALGAVSAFFPMVLSVAAGVRGVDKVLLSVGASFRLTRWQIVRMIYLPALIAPISVGLRLAFGLAMVGCLLAEIALSNQGLGYLASQYYAHFQIPQMYAVLLVVFVLAAAGNAAIVRLVRPRGVR
jgi:ABC-type nitrate/sulfonate/bicarbonate transport system permease component